MRRGDEVANALGELALGSVLYGCGRWSDAPGRLGRASGALQEIGCETGYADGKAALPVSF
jgi:hypothetical protein